MVFMIHLWHHHAQRVIRTLCCCAQDRELVARVDISRDANQVMHLTVWDEQAEQPELPLNAVQVRDGWAKVARRPDRRLPADLLEQLRAAQEAVKKDRVRTSRAHPYLHHVWTLMHDWFLQINIWSYGDFSDGEGEEEEKKSQQKSAWGARR